MARDAQRAAVRRWHLLHVDVVAYAPFPGVGQQELAVREAGRARALGFVDARQVAAAHQQVHAGGADRKSTRLNSSHLVISYAVFCLKKKKRVKHDMILMHASLESIRRPIGHPLDYISECICHYDCVDLATSESSCRIERD